MVVRRWAAFALDSILISAYLVVLVGVGLVAGPAARDVFVTPARAEAAGFVLLTLPVVLYFVVTEGGPSGATWGKRRLRLRVLGPGGRPAGVVRCALRSAVKFLPWELAHASIWHLVLPTPLPQPVAEIGTITAMALAALWAVSLWFWSGRQAICDRVAGTHVVPVG